MDFKATAFAADLSSIGWLDKRMLRRLADGMAAPERRESSFAHLKAWILGFPGFYEAKPYFVTRGG